MEINFIHTAIISNYLNMQLFFLTKKKHAHRLFVLILSSRLSTRRRSDPNHIHLKSPKMFANIFFVQAYLLYVWVYEFMALILVCWRKNKLGHPEWLDFLILKLKKMSSVRRKRSSYCRRPIWRIWICSHRHFKNPSCEIFVMESQLSSPISTMCKKPWPLSCMQGRVSPPWMTKSTPLSLLYCFCHRAVKKTVWL